MCYLCSLVSAVYEFVCANFFLFLCITQSAVISLAAASVSPPENIVQSVEPPNLNPGGLQSSAVFLAELTGGRSVEALGGSFL